MATTTNETIMDSATGRQRLPDYSTSERAPIPVTTADRLLPSSEVARRLGVKRQTLSKWRMKRRGPQGWFHLNPTRCVYPESEVTAYIRGLADRRPAFNLPRRKPTRDGGVA